MNLHESACKLRFYCLIFYSENVDPQINIPKKKYKRVPTVSISLCSLLKASR